MDFSEIESKLTAVAQDSPGLIPDIPLVVEIDKLEEGRYTVVLSAWASSANFSNTKRELNQRVVAALKDIYRKK